ncbi:hypothetical protein RRG08_016195 [Elysia crispata]|uniref:Uncharacterized protein n=1 Tax=Elysia crispata TaxID=231223 RepID=A0AAE0ZQC0_9GAST|nr:hypothetical protein RRG08_016195 [Elysia crispata]
MIKRRKREEEQRKRQLGTGDSPSLLTSDTASQRQHLDSDGVKSRRDQSVLCMEDLQQGSNLALKPRLPTSRVTERAVEQQLLVQQSHINACKNNNHSDSKQNQKPL